MQIIHRYHNEYPFNKPHESDQTYLQVIKECPPESGLREQYRALRDTKCATLMRVVRLLKEGNHLHILYEYCQQSYRGYLESLPLTTNTLALEKEFMGALREATAALVGCRLKADIYLSNVGVLFTPLPLIKVFVDADCESSPHEAALREFYAGEEDRLRVEMHELMQEVFKLHEEEDKPNFLISGTKLVFINPAIEKQIQHNSRLSSRYPKEGKKEENNAQFKKIQNIIQNASQCIQEENQFKPEEFTKEQTYVLEQNEYLTELEDELKNISVQKKDESKTKLVHAPVAPKLSQTPQSGLSFNKSSQIEEKKSEGSLSMEEGHAKSHKRTMKIITSHEIEFEGNDEEIEKELMERIKSGKLNINPGQKVMINKYKHEEVKVEEVREESTKKTNYLDKVKEVREKAEMLLKSYGKDKHL